MKGKRKKLLIAGAVLAVLLAVFFLVFWGFKYPFEASFIDVGQGDCALVVCDGKSMLIDGGNNGDGEKIAAYLKDRGIRRIDVLIATHPHSDHIGGLPYIVENFEVKSAYISPCVYTSKIYESFLDALYEQDIKTIAPKAGESYELGGAECRFVSSGSGYDDANNSSLVLRINYKDISVLFTGDIEAEAESRILESGEMLDCTLLKVAHHGSDTSSTEEFIKAVSPEIAVISVGKGNSYGHPSQRVLERLETVELRRTDLEGTIVYVSDGESLMPEKRRGIYLGICSTGKLHSLCCLNRLSFQNIVPFFQRAW
ncbi:MAG: ComEC/Rec2 family competence protein [Clostridiaceae bacterium]|nr:ComEC/Rec2 family competence protein [Clostridiaceae bacterium]